MKAQLVAKPHSQVPGAQVFEVWWNARLVCTLAGLDGPGVRVISKYVNAGVSIERDDARPGIPDAINIRLDLPPVG